MSVERLNPLQVVSLKCPFRPPDVGTSCSASRSRNRGTDIPVRDTGWKTRAPMRLRPGYCRPAPACPEGAYPPHMLCFCRTRRLSPDLEALAQASACPRTSGARPSRCSARKPETISFRTTEGGSRGHSPSTLRVFAPSCETTEQCSSTKPLCSLCSLWFQKPSSAFTLKKLCAL